MYAIVKAGGKQYRVEKGQKLLIERVREDEGATLTLEPVFYRSDDVVFGADDLKKVKVEAKVVEHLRGPKIRVFKFKPKRGYKRTQGHRQELTRIEITAVGMASRKPAAKASAADEPAAKKPAAKKPAAKKPAAKKPAAKKPAAAASKEA